MRAQVDLASGWALFRRIVAFFVIHETRLEVTDTKKLIANPRLGELRQTKLLASQHRRVMYGQSPLKQRMMNVGELIIYLCMHC